MASPLSHFRPRPEERTAWKNILLLLALSLLAYGVWLFCDARTYTLEVPAWCDRAVSVRAFLDRGNGMEETGPLLGQTCPPGRTRLLRFRFPAGPLKAVALHFSPAKGAVLHLGQMAVRAPDGEPVAGALPESHEFSNLSEMTALEPVTGGGWSGRIDDTAAYPSGRLDQPRPVPLPFDGHIFGTGLLPALCAYPLGALSVLLLWRRLMGRERFRRRAEAGAAKLARWHAGAGRAARAYPRAALWLAAAAGVMVSCYPVVFFGKSFVSPNISTQMLYDRLPTLPGAVDGRAESSQGSDTAAGALAIVPYSAIAHRALFEHGELPLWNRYNAGGASFIGQGQTSLGDPIHLLLVLAGGNAGAWDLKFLLARWLFAAGVGLCVRAATGRSAAAALLAFSACFLGFFGFRFNHPAYFSMCYAPWILYPWLEIARGEGGGQRTARWAALLMLAVWMELNSGTVKEACMQIVCLNGAGALALLLSDRLGWDRKWRTLAGLAWAGVCLGLASAPFWGTLLGTLLHSWNDYLHPFAWQLQPGLCIGLFDDIFQRQFQVAENVLDPSTNFVVGLGICFALGSAKTLARRRRTFLALGLAALAPCAVVFGVVPWRWIASIPFLGNILHTDNVFSAVLIVLLLVLAGFGLEHLRARLGAPGFGWDAAAAGGVLAVGLALFLGFTQAVQRTTFLGQKSMPGLPYSVFFGPYVFSLVAGVVALPFFLWLWRRGGAGVTPGVAPWIVICLGVLLWRSGQQVHGGIIEWTRYVFYPPARVNLLARSPAVETLLARARQEPGRCLGLGNNLFPGYASSLGLETPSGPDALQNPYHHRLLKGFGTTLFWSWRLAADRQTVNKLRRFYDLLNVRYYAAARGADGAPHEEIPGLRPAGRFDLDLYESDTAWPRAFFIDSLAPGSSNADLFALILAGDGRPFATIGLPELERPEAASIRGLLKEGNGGAERTVVSAGGYRLTNNTTAFRLRAPGPGMAVLLEGYQEHDAQVTVNGQPAPHFRVDEAFMGVYLPRAGEYEVIFRYRPRHWTALLWASAAGFVLMVGTAVWVRRRFAG